MQAIGPCETEGVAPTAYIETSLEAAAMVKSDYLNCAADNSCDSKVAESRGTGPGYRDFTAEAEDGADGEYAYMMVGNLFGDTWGGYLGAASYFNTGTTTISTSTNDVFVAHPGTAGHVTRGESTHGAPIGGDDGINVCIATSTTAADTSCTGTRSFPPGAYKVCAPPPSPHAATRPPEPRHRRRESSRAPCPYRRTRARSSRSSVTPTRRPTAATRPATTPRPRPTAIGASSPTTSACARR